MVVVFQVCETVVYRQAAVVCKQLLAKRSVGAARGRSVSGFMTLCGSSRASGKDVLLLVLVATAAMACALQTLAWHSPPTSLCNLRRTRWLRHHHRSARRHQHRSTTRTTCSTAERACELEALPASLQDDIATATSIGGDAVGVVHQDYDAGARGLPSWSQARFSVTLPQSRGPRDRSRSITKTVANGLSPLLSGVTAGVGLLQVINSTATLAVGPTNPSSSSYMSHDRANDDALCSNRKSSANENIINESGRRSNSSCRTSDADTTNEASLNLPTGEPVPGEGSEAVALSLLNGNAVWPAENELWLTLTPASDRAGHGFLNTTTTNTRQEGFVGEEGEGAITSGFEAHSLSPQQRRGSDRFDFLVVWSCTMTAATPGDKLDAEDPRYSTITRNTPMDIDGDRSSDATSSNGFKGGDIESDSGGRGGMSGGVEESWGGDRGSASSLSSRGMGPSGGHVVGELRPLNEFSAQRQAALDEALETVGVDARELTEADEFFGTAALKSYNTFVRPRPKQLAKVMQEPIERAALRTAHQIAFLVRRHKADRAEYLRNKDASMTEAERRGLAPHPVVLVCDNVRSAYNVGSIFRSADTARVAEVVTCGFTPHPGGHGEDKVRKTAFGSIDAVPHRHFEDPAEAVVSLKAAGVLVCALETTEGALSLFEVTFPLPPLPQNRKHIQADGHSLQQTSAGVVDDDVLGCFKSVEHDSVHGGKLEKGSDEKRAVGSTEEDTATSRAMSELEGVIQGGDEAGVGGGQDVEEGHPVVALVLGNEVTGVDERVLNLCDLVVEVPVFGLKNSLNVASAGTVVLYEVLRQWSLAGRLVGGTELDPTIFDGLGVADESGRSVLF